MANLRSKSSAARAGKSASAGDIVGIPGAAAYLDVEHKFIRRKIASGELPAYRLGGRLIKIKIADLDRLLVPMRGAAS